MNFTLYFKNVSLLSVSQIIIICIFLGTMFVKHLGCDAVFAVIMGGGPGRSGSSSDDHLVIRGGHHHHSTLYGRHLYQWRSQRRSAHFHDKLY